MQPGYHDIELYTADGWPNMEYFASVGAALTVLIGARRIGKTYGVLSRYICKTPILYLRISKTDLDKCTIPVNDPFKPVGKNIGIDTEFVKSGDSYIVYEVTERDDKDKPVSFGRMLAQASSIYSTRGIASGQYGAILFDEFIPDPGKAKRANMGYNFKNSIQSVTDRYHAELPVWAVSNSNSLDSDVLQEFELISVYEEMRQSDNNCWLSPGGEIFCIDFKKSPVSEELKQTRLGRILNTGTYGDMAFENDWSNNNFANVRRLPGNQVREYADTLHLGDIMIMMHKSEDWWYIRKAPNCPAKVPHWDVTPDTQRDIGRVFFGLLTGVAHGNITYDSFETKRKFNDYALGGRYKL
jgi:hypothetical protein